MIEEGKFYVSRDGRRVGPMKFRVAPSPVEGWVNVSELGGGWTWAGDKKGRYWNSQGNIPNPLDLVSEWSRADDTPRPWRELTDEEQGALLLAAHRGQVIEVMDPITHEGLWVSANGKGWLDHCVYRIKPEPEIETVAFEGWVDSTGWWSGKRTPGANYKIAFDTRDGEPVLDSIKMEKV